MHVRDAAGAAHKLDAIHSQTARTSAAPDGYRSIPGHSVLCWSFHNPLAVHRSLLAVRLCLQLYRSRRLPAARVMLAVRQRCTSFDVIQQAWYAVLHVVIHKGTEITYAYGYTAIVSVRKQGCEAARKSCCVHTAMRSKRPPARVYCWGVDGAARDRAASMYRTLCRSSLCATDPFYLPRKAAPGLILSRCAWRKPPNCDGIHELDGAGTADPTHEGAYMWLVTRR
jgi:hypothetical protein